MGRRERNVAWRQHSHHLSRHLKRLPAGWGSRRRLRQPETLRRSRDTQAIPGTRPIQATRRIQLTHPTPRTLATPIPPIRYILGISRRPSRSPRRHPHRYHSRPTARQRTPRQAPRLIHRTRQTLPTLATHPIRHIPARRIRHTLTRRFLPCHCIRPTPRPPMARLRQERYLARRHHHQRRQRHRPCPRVVVAYCSRPFWEASRRL